MTDDELLLAVMKRLLRESWVVTFDHGDVILDCRLAVSDEETAAIERASEKYHSEPGLTWPKHGVVSFTL